MGTVDMKRLVKMLKSPICNMLFKYIIDSELANRKRNKSTAQKRDE
jgi:hypothetical protein